MRWKHPSEGYISPARFIPVAEETGLIARLGEFVIERVVDDMVAVAQGRQHGAGAGRGQCFARPARSAAICASGSPS